MKKESVLIAVLGIVIGILLSVTVQKLGSRKKILNVEGDWRKINLILESLEKNYVDSIDKEKVTDAAAVAILSALDPHSIYMPPATL